MKSKITAALFSFFLSLSAWGQMVSQLSDDASTTGTGLGQSFTAPATTQITKISVRPRTAYSGTLHIYNGGSGSGVMNSVGTPAYSQPVALLAATSSGGPMQEVVLTTPFPVTVGNTYTFIFEGASNLYVSLANPYSAGYFKSVYLISTPSNDLAFEIWSAPLSPASATTASIPTLSQWGVIFLGGLMGLFAFVRMRRAAP